MSGRERTLRDTILAPARLVKSRLHALYAGFDNARLARDFHANEQDWLARADAAVGRACDWFAPQADLTMSALYVTWQGWRLGAEPRFAFIHDKIAHYRATLRDPALRLFDAGYDPDAPECRSLPDIMAVRPYFAEELLMIDMVWADKRPSPDIIPRLAAIEDGGGYGTTHIVVGGQVLLRNGGADRAAVERLLAGTIGSMVRGNRETTYAGDLYAERIVMLQWLGRHDLVDPAWILRLLAAQMPDGGWAARNIPPLGGSNQHTTCLAMAAIAQFRANRLGRLSGPAD